MQTTSKMRCPCFSGASYKKCCRPYHRGDRLPDPEALMRSRYAAYSRGLVDYIVETSGEPHEDLVAFRAGVKQFSDTAVFGGLQILAVEPGEREAFVTFRATVAFGDMDASFTERSRFLKTERWRYVSGERL